MCGALDIRNTFGAIGSYWLGGVDESLRGLELGFGMNDFGAAVAFGLGLFRDGAQHVFREFDGSDLDVAHLGRRC